MKMYSVVPLALAMSCSLGMLSGCSSSGSSSTDASISGTIVAAPVNGADVSVVDGNGNVVAGPVKTNGTGQYTLSIPEASLAQDLILKSSGGTFKDEATGSNGNAGEMLAYVPVGSLSDGDSVSATPGSTIIANMVMNHSINMTQAQTAFQNAFGYTPDVTINPVDATVTNADASDESKLAGLRAAAFSQLAMDLNLMVTTSVAEQFEMFKALADDLSDDELNGVGSTGDVVIGTTGETVQSNIRNQFANALVNFHDDGNEMYMGNDLTGLGSNQIGVVPFSKVAITSDGNYKIEYVPGMMSAMEGKATFKLHITNLAGVDQPDLTPTLMPMMHMETMTHSSPKPEVSVIYDGSGGMYTATVYYLMASQMGDGSSMGYWDIKVDVDGDLMATTADAVHFYPPVMMAMGDTVQAKLKGVDDKIMSMIGGMEGRTYFIYKDSLTGSMGSYDFSMFIAAKQDMKNFPAVYDSSALSGNALDVTVDVSDDDGVSWTTLTAGDGSGIWSVTNLSLTDGMEDQIRVRLTVNDTVNDEMKTTDGAIRVVGSNDYATFTVTPGSM